jgi:hypothetical protein
VSGQNLQRAKDPSTPVEELLRLAEQFPAEALANPAWMLPGNEQAIRQLSPFLLIKALRAWEQVPSFWMGILPNVPYRSVRLALAQKPLSTDALSKLVQDPDPEVRTRAWVHPQSQQEPVRGLVTLLQALERDEPGALARALNYPPQSQGPHMKMLLAQHAQTPEATLLNLAREGRPLLLRSFAQRKNLSESLLEALWPGLEANPQEADAFWERTDLSAPFRLRLLKLSPQRLNQETLSSLSEKDLLRLLDGPIPLRIALALQAGLSVRILEALASDAEVAVRAEVARHPALPETLRQKLQRDPARLVREIVQRRV